MTGMLRWRDNVGVGWRPGVAVRVRRGCECGRRKRLAQKLAEKGDAVTIDNGGVG